MGYVGQTITPFCVRWANHVSRAKKDISEHGGKVSYLHRAMKKYGVENFETCILAEAHTLDELNALEDFHIRAQNTLSPNGYNLKAGGGGRKCSYEARKHISEARKGKGNGLRGRLVPDETKRRISASLMGKKHTQERRANQSSAHKGKSWSEAQRAAYNRRMELQ